MKKRILILISVLLSYSAYANDLAPVPVQSTTPDRAWFYNLEDVVFDSDDSYVPNGYISYTKWYINGVEETGGSYRRSMSMCFALPGSPAGDCYQLASGQTTVQIKLEVASNHGYWESETITYTIQQHKGRKYFLKDHLGNVRTTVNRDGNVLGHDDYYPFGLVMPDRSNNTGNPNDAYKFTGHERDDEVGLTLDYMMARNYDPIIGRFLQIDPLAALYPNLSPYTYVANNPLIYIDPTGMWIAEYDEDGNIVNVRAEEGDDLAGLYDQLGITGEQFAEQFGIDDLGGFEVVAGETTFDITSFALNSTNFDGSFTGSNCHGFCTQAEGSSSSESQQSQFDLTGYSETDSPTTGNVAIFNMEGQFQYKGQSPVDASGIQGHSAIYLLKDASGNAQFLNRINTGMPVTVNTIKQINSFFANPNNAAGGANAYTILPKLSKSPVFYKK